MTLNFTVILDLLGTFAFAISGIRLASGKNVDWFGAFIIGLVTAIGGGTTRDLLLGKTPFWMVDGSYFLTTAAALLAVLIFKKKIFRWGRTLFLFDAIGLGLFTVVGISVGLEAGLAFWICVILGMMSGTVGGILRDVLLNQVPLIFRRDIYALASVCGGVVYYLFYKLEFPADFNEIVAALSVIAVRIVAIRYKIHLPILTPINSGANASETSSTSDSTLTK